VPEALVTMAREHRCVVVVEDGIRAGGVAGAVAQALRDARVTTPLRDFGIPARFLEHAKRAEILVEIGLTAQDIARDIVETVAHLQTALEDESVGES
jgi:1-deoxy-D-xylulose-5-phosphate synthase